jgi:hypothetical protein
LLGVVLHSLKLKRSVVDTSSTGSKFTAGGVYRGVKFATGIVGTCGAPCLANVFANFHKKFEVTLILFSGAWGKMIHGKKT